MNALLKLELKRKMQIKRLILAIVARAVSTTILFSLVLLAKLADGILALFISLSITILLFTPASVINSLISRSAGQETSELLFTKIKRPSIILYKLIISNIYNIIIVIIANIVIFSFLYDHQKMTPAGISNVNIVLLAFMTFSSALTIVLVALFNCRILGTSFCVYFIISVLLFSFIIVGPFLLRTDNQKVKDIMTQSSLYVNPVIMLVRSMGKIDIMRTDYVYNIADPIVGRGFTYPDWQKQCLGYFVVSIAFISIAVLSSPLFLRN